jgi:muramoyltetrapeptide carboxypeptidase
MLSAKPKPLSPNATVGIIAPGSAADPKLFAEGLAELQAQGFKVRCPLDPTRDCDKYHNNFSNGSPKERVEVLHQLFEDPEVEAIFTSRGGYGSLELLPLIDFKKIAANPKIIVGFSDVTALLVSVLLKSKIPTVHGVGVANGFANFKREAEAKTSVTRLLELLSKTAAKQSLEGQIIREGDASGYLLSGNLTMLCSLLGTPWDISYDGAILLVEDVSEAPYRVQRQLMQLKLAGKLEKLAGLGFGEFINCDTKEGPTVSEVFRRFVREYLANTTYPVLSGLPFGHGNCNFPIPLGCEASIAGASVLVNEPPIE